MQQRQLSPTGDYTFGTNQPFLNNTPQCVAQAVLTRLKLMTGEWFLDTSEGTPYEGQILGHNTGPTRDIAIRIRILGTQGVVRIVQYASALDSKRRFTVAAVIETQYGQAALSTTL